MSLHPSPLVLALRAVRDLLRGGDPVAAGEALDAALAEPPRNLAALRRDLLVLRTEVNYALAEARSAAETIEALDDLELDASDAAEVKALARAAVDQIDRVDQAHFEQRDQAYLEHHVVPHGLRSAAVASEEGDRTRAVFRVCDAAARAASRDEDVSGFEVALQRLAASFGHGAVSADVAAWEQVRGA